jgi:dynactin complex subunit
MASNPLSTLKRRLSAAIDWRVRQEFEAERELMMEINDSLTTLNTAYTDKISALEKLVESLDRRLTAVEKSK